MRQGQRLTGDGDVAVGFSLVDHVHDLVRAGDETLGASLTELEHERSLTDVHRQNKTRSVRQKTRGANLYKRHPVLVLVHRQVGLGHWKQKKKRIGQSLSSPSAAKEGQENTATLTVQQVTDFVHVDFKVRDLARKVEKSLVSRPWREQGQITGGEKAAQTLMWNSRFSSMAKIWLKMSSAIRGMMPIWWGSCSLPCERQSQSQATTVKAESKQKTLIQNWTSQCVTSMV